MFCPNAQIRNTAAARAVSGVLTTSPTANARLRFQNAAANPKHTTRKPTTHVRKENGNINVENKMT